MSGANHDPKAGTVAGQNPQPFSFRLPPNGEVDPWFGGSRTFWASLIRSNGKPAVVKSFSIKQPGAKRGIRFIDFASARTFMEQQQQRAA